MARILVLLFLTFGVASSDTGRRWRRFAPRETGLLQSIFPNVGRANACAIDRRGGLLAVGGSKGRVRVYRTGAWSVRHQFAAQKRGVLALAFRPGGSELAVVGADQTIIVFDLATGTAKTRMRGATGLPRSIDWSRDGKWIVTGGIDRTVRIWNPKTGRLERTLRGHAGIVHQVSFAPKGALLVSAASDGTIRIFSTQQWKEVLTLRAGDRQVTAFAMTADGSKLYAATSGRGSWVREWNLRNGRLLRSSQNRLSGRVTALRVVPGGRYLALSVETSVQIWGTNRLRLISTLKHHTQQISTLVVSPQSRWIASTGADMVVKIWGFRRGGMSKVPPKGFFGVRVQDAGGNQGARVTNVIANTAALEAGVRVGDVIVNVGGEPVGDLTSAIAAIGTRSEGQELSFTLLRGGKKIQMKVRLGKRPTNLDP